MTLLHQAAQKAVAVPLVEQLRSIPSDAKLRIDTPNALGCMDTCSIPVGRLCHEAASALQQQPEPVAIWQSCFTRGGGAAWSDCSESNARAAEKHGYPCRVLYTAPPALQQQEVPREPVARNPLPAETAQPMFASHVGRRKWEQLQGDGYRMQRIHFARSVDGHERRGTIDPWGKVLWEAESASPATTQQQEAGNTAAVHLTADEIASLMMDLSDHDGSDFEPECPSCTAFRKLASACVAAAPTTPESAEKDDAGGVAIPTAYEVVYFRRRPDESEDWLRVPVGTAKQHVREELITRIVPANGVGGNDET